MTHGCWLDPHPASSSGFAIWFCAVPVAPLSPVPSFLVSTLGLAQRFKWRVASLLQANRSSGRTQQQAMVAKTTVGMRFSDSMRKSQRTNGTAGRVYASGDDDNPTWR